MGHKEIGERLELFMFSQEIGSGLPIWLPDGEFVRHEMIEFLRQEQTWNGYQHVVSPSIANADIYKQSGHYPYYSDTMFPVMRFDDAEEKEYLLRPMNCPHHHTIFAHGIRSYRELPLRIAEFGTVFRYEQSGALNGMLRLRNFTQDDAHIYCAQNQLRDEIKNVFALATSILKHFGFNEFSVDLSFHDDNREKYFDNEELWQKAEEDVQSAVNDLGIACEIHPGEASFYGPKIDFSVQDSMGRKWQLGTIQVDYVMPERFNLEFVDADGTKQRPVVIHRACLGSIERFLAILLEATDGRLPFWLQPCQAIILPISEHQQGYAQECQSLLSDDLHAGGLNWRVEVDATDETLAKRVLNAESRKVPFIIVVGRKEAEAKSLSVRRSGGGAAAVIPRWDFVRKASIFSDPWGSLDAKKLF